MKAMLALAILAASISGAMAQLAPSTQATTAATAAVSVCFTPERSCLPVLLGQIAGARSEILVQAHNFTSRAVMNALVDAKKRGVDVQVIMQAKHERTQSRALRTIAEGGIPVFIDAPKGVAHNKVMIFDRKAVTTGSYNFTNAADRRNAENLVLIENSPAVVDAYVQNWQARRKLSKPARIGPAPVGEDATKDDDDDDR